MTYEFSTTKNIYKYQFFNFQNVFVQKGKSTSDRDSDKVYDETNASMKLEGTIIHTDDAVETINTDENGTTIPLMQLIQQLLR